MWPKATDWIKDGCSCHDVTLWFVQLCYETLSWEFQLLWPFLKVNVTCRFKFLQQGFHFSDLKAASLFYTVYSCRALLIWKSQRYPSVFTALDNFNFKRSQIGYIAELSFFMFHKAENRSCQTLSHSWKHPVLFLCWIFMFSLTPPVVLLHLMCACFYPYTQTAVGHIYF